MGSLNCKSKNSHFMLFDNKNEVIVFTSDDVGNIKNTWNYVCEKGLRKNGHDMMIKIFLHHRDVQSLWKFASRLENKEQMLASTLLKAHGEKVFNSIHRVITEFLDDINGLEAFLTDLGRVHFHFGVRDEHFTVIGEYLLITIRDCARGDFNNKVKLSWVKLFEIIKFYMVIGLEEEEANAFKHVK